MKTNFAKHFSPQPRNQLKPRFSLKENCEKQTLELKQPDQSRVFSQLNDYETTDKQRKSLKRSETMKQSILEIRHSIKEILDESVKATKEIKKIRDKLETNFSNRENSSHPEFDESSILYSPTKDISFNNQISELKSQLCSLNDRLDKGEARIRQKNVENFNLQFTIFSLSHKIEKLRKNKKPKSTCQIF